MNTKVLMMTCSLCFGASGIILIFLPDVVLRSLCVELNQPTLLLGQIIGGLYFGFCMLNWMTKESRIGGIYNRPIVIANLSYFLIAGLGLIKALISNPSLPLVLWIAGIVTTIFGLFFAILLFIHPHSE